LAAKLTLSVKLKKILSKTALGITQRTIQKKFRKHKFIYTLDFGY